jgi:hypothetical protein
MEKLIDDFANLNNILTENGLKGFEKIIKIDLMKEGEYNELELLKKQYYNSNPAKIMESITPYFINFFKIKGKNIEDYEFDDITINSFSKYQNKKEEIIIKEKDNIIEFSNEGKEFLEDLKNKLTNFNNDVPIIMEFNKVK